MENPYISDEHQDIAPEQIRTARAWFDYANSDWFTHNSQADWREHPLADPIHERGLNTLLDALDTRTFSTEKNEADKIKHTLDIASDDIKEATHLINLLFLYETALITEYNQNGARSKDIKRCKIPELTHLLTEVADTVDYHDQPLGTELIQTNAILTGLIEKIGKELNIPKLPEGISSFVQAAHNKGGGKSTSGDIEHGEDGTDYKGR